MGTHLTLDLQYCNSYISRNQLTYHIFDWKDQKKNIVDLLFQFVKNSPGDHKHLFTLLAPLVVFLQHCNLNTVSQKLANFSAFIFSVLWIYWHSAIDGILGIIDVLLQLKTRWKRPEGELRGANFPTPEMEYWADTLLPRIGWCSVLSHDDILVR